jgi:hypothetical protein
MNATVIIVSLLSNACQRHEYAEHECANCTPSEHEGDSDKSSDDESDEDQEDQFNEQAEDESTDAMREREHYGRTSANSQNRDGN